ncbi:MAG: DUF3717 domain-containing protein [Burkholderiaceae bacterium]
MAAIHIADVEAAINWWRVRVPADAATALGAEVGALAHTYGQMIAQRTDTLDEETLSLDAIHAFETWAHSLPDSPCIAICSTSVGDPKCTGCGRTFDEVTRWTGMPVIEKRAVWRRITAEGTWLRFTPRYADRLIEQ